MKKGMSVWKGMSGKKKTAVAIVSLAGICILGTGVFWARNKMSKWQPVGNASVQEASAASGDTANPITGTGSLEADDSDTVKIPSGITIKEVKVESGDAVSKGDVLAVVEETSVLGAMEEVQEQIEETEEDMKEIAHLAEKVAERYYQIPKDQRNGKCQIVASTSFFIPKPFTPFQWATMCNKEDYIQKAHIVNNEMKAQLNRKSLKYNWHEADVTVLEGVFARGDRKVSKVILEAYKMGCLYDSWSEFFDNEKWIWGIRFPLRFAYRSVAQNVLFMKR